MSSKFLYKNVIFALVLLLIIAAGCQVGNDKPDGGGALKPAKDINKVKDEHSEELMKIEGVVGVYVTELDDKTPCIAVMVVKKSKELEMKIPKYLDGYKVIIDETGEIKPMGK